MRNYKGIFIFLALSVIVTACTQPNVSYPNTAGSKPVLTLSKTNVKIGEPLLVTSVGGRALGSLVHWSASPNAATWTSANGDSATFLFTSAGIYQVSATYLYGASGPAYDSTHSSLIVSDSLYNGDSTVVVCNALINAPIATGDLISLTPITFSDSAGLVFLANTQNTYNYAPVLSVTGNFTGQGGPYECDFNSVIESPCIGYNLQAPATTDVFFSTPANGTYGLVMKLNGTTYQGSMTVTNSSCTFTWNYTTGIMISPLQIQKF